MAAAGYSVLFIVGPTAAGKSGLAVSLARRFNGEIINADSRQVYRHLDIGTAKPTAEQRRQVPHHLLDLLEPDQSFHLGSFLAQARASIAQVQGRGRLPVVAGGTGQYVWALLEGWQVPAVPPDPQFRQAKELEAQQRGARALHRQLESIDPQRAAELDPRNVRRVVRALEIHQGAQRRPSEFPRRAEPLPGALVLGLSLDREELYRRIDARVDGMLAQGLLEEVRRLAALGYRLGWGPLASPGYRELGQYLAGELTLAEAVRRTKFQTHRLARRQNTWFKEGDRRIHWLDGADPNLETRAVAVVGDFLKRPTTVVQ